MATGRVQTLDWSQITHNMPPQQLKFYLGAPSKSYKACNGAYFDPDFDIRAGSFLGTAAAVEEVLNKQRAAPVINPGIHLIPLVDKTKFFNSNFQSSQIRKEYPTEYNGAQSYSIWGWFKWSQPQRYFTWHNLVRVSTNEPSYQKDFSDVGDRTLAIWIRKK